MGRDPRGGYTSGPRPVSDLRPPPKGPGAGAQLELLYECRLCGEKHLRVPAGEPVVGPRLRPVEDVEPPGPDPANLLAAACKCPCHKVTQPGLDLCPDCGTGSDFSSQSPLTTGDDDM